MSIIRTSAVNRDLSRYVNWILEDSGTKAALDFAKDYEKTLERLEHMPLSGSLYDEMHPRLNRLRWAPIHKHPKHLIFYVPVKAKSIRVLRIFHFSQNIAALLEYCDPASE